MTDMLLQLATCHCTHVTCDAVALSGLADMTDMQCCESALSREFNQSCVRLLATVRWYPVLHYQRHLPGLPRLPGRLKQELQ